MDNIDGQLDIALIFGTPIPAHHVKTGMVISLPNGCQCEYKVHLRYVQYGQEYWRFELIRACSDECQSSLHEVYSYSFSSTDKVILISMEDCNAQDE